MIEHILTQTLTKIEKEKKKLSISFPLKLPLFVRKIITENMFPPKMDD